MQVQDIVDEALKLDEPQRIEIAELLMASLGPPDPAIEKAWAEEAARRIQLELAAWLATGAKPKA